MNIGHCNTHSSFKDRVYMSNLCQEITLLSLFNTLTAGEIELMYFICINVGIIIEGLEGLYCFLLRA